MAFIIADAAGKQLAVPQGRLKGGRFPQLERLGRLDIIMIVEEQRPVALPARSPKTTGAPPVSMIWTSKPRLPEHFRTS